MTIYIEFENCDDEEIKIHISPDIFPKIKVNELAAMIAYLKNKESEWFKVKLDGDMDKIQIKRGMVHDKMMSLRLILLQPTWDFYVRVKKSESTLGQINLYNYNSLLADLKEKTLINITSEYITSNLSERLQLYTGYIGNHLIISSIFSPLLFVAHMLKLLNRNIKKQVWQSIKVEFEYFIKLMTSSALLLQFSRNLSYEVNVIVIPIIVFLFNLHFLIGLNKTIKVRFRQRWIKDLPDGLLVKNNEIKNNIKEVRLSVFRNVLSKNND